VETQRRATENIGTNHQYDNGFPPIERGGHPGYVYQQSADAGRSPGSRRWHLGDAIWQV